MNVTFPPWSLGSLIAVIILIVVIILVIIGHLSPFLGCLIGGLALARLT